jgi:hypothetical protein
LATCPAATNVCTLPPTCSEPFRKELAQTGTGTGGTTQCQLTNPNRCQQTIQVNLDGAVQNKTYRVWIDQNAIGSQASHIDAGTFTTDGNGDASYTATVTHTFNSGAGAGICPTVVDNEVNFQEDEYFEHQFIQDSFQPCPFCPA